MPRHVPKGNRRLTLGLSMTLPLSVGMQELRAYVKDAVEDWGGQRRPDDHLFYTIKDVTIREITVPPVPKDHRFPMLWKATEGKINPENLIALKAEFDTFMALGREMFAPVEGQG